MIEKCNTVAVFKEGKCHVGTVVKKKYRKALVHLRNGEIFWIDERKLRTYKGKL